MSFSRLTVLAVAALFFASTTPARAQSCPPGTSVDAAANVDQRQLSDTCSSRGLTKEACTAAGGHHFSAGTGAGPTSCFFRPKAEAMAPAPLPEPARTSLGGLVTFRITNAAKYQIRVKFFAKKENQVWPAAGTSYQLADRKEHAFRLNCKVGQRICFGAFYDSGKNWGAGRYGKIGCARCCLSCGTVESNVSYGWTLND